MSALLLGDALDRAHPDSLVEADGGGVLRLDLQLHVRRPPGLKGPEGESEQALAEAAPTPALVHDEVLHERARPADRGRGEIVADMHEEAQLRVELAVARERREPAVVRLDAAASSAIPMLEQGMELQGARAFEAADAAALGPGRLRNLARQRDAHAQGLERRFG